MNGGLTVTEALTVFGLLVVAAVFLYAAYLWYKKEWRFGATASLLLFAFFFSMALPATREFLRSTVWVSFVTTLEATGQGRLNGVVDNVHRELQEGQEELAQQQFAIARAQSDISDAQTAIAAAQDSVATQQEKLADVSHLTTALYAERKTHQFKGGRSPEKYQIVDHGNDQASVYIFLDDVPIRQSLELQWHIYLQPPNSYRVDGNVVVFRWGGAAAQLEQKPMFVSYVPHPDEVAPYAMLSNRDGRVWADSEPFFWAFLESDPALRQVDLTSKPTTMAEARKQLRESLAKKLGSGGK